MGRDGPTLPLDSTEARDVLDLLLFNPFLPDHRQAEQSDSDPGQLPEPPEQREGDAGHVGVSKGSRQEHIPAVLGAEAAGDEERG